MSYHSMTKYVLKGFRKSKTKDKKYDAILMNKETRRLKHIPFGNPNYQHYKDSTGLGLYSHKDHGDKKRRDSYHARHKGYIKDGYYSAGYFSLNYLW